MDLSLPGVDQTNWATPLNNALTSLNNGKADRALTARSGVGINVPAGWGANWRAKLAAAQAGTGKAVLATVGGSSTQGYYASNLRQKGWVDLVRTSFQSTYGDGGSGFRGAGLTGVVQAADGVPAAATTAYNANGTNATLVGSWSVGGNSFGPGAKYVFTSTVGDSYTVNVRGTQVDIYVVAGSTSPHTTFSYQIDGGTVVNVPTTGTADNIQKTTVTGLSAGVHSVVLRHAGTAGQFVSICGVAGTNATGTVVNNFARYGSRAANFAAADSTINTDWNGAFQYPADLVILTHAPNDVNNGAGQDTVTVWANNIRTIMDRIRNNGGALGATDVMIVLPHIGTFDTTNNFYPLYSDEASALATTYGCALVNMWTVGRNSWAYWNSLGYWSNASNPGVAGTDNVHPSDAGHAFIASVISPIISLV